jgi:uncharacterized protein YukE
MAAMFTLIFSDALDRLRSDTTSVASSWKRTASVQFTSFNRQRSRQYGIL